MTCVLIKRLSDANVLMIGEVIEEVVIHNNDGIKWLIEKVK